MMRQTTNATILAILLTGCATMGETYRPAPLPPEGQALVYVLRSRIPIGGGWPTNFKIDGKDAVTLSDKGYSWVHLRQGLHSFAAGNLFGENLRMNLEIEAGKTYYVEYTQEHFGTQYRLVLASLPEPLGQATVATYQYKRAE